MTKSAKSPIDPSESNQWKGYTLDDIRYLRALNAIKIEVAQERVAKRLSTENGIGHSNLISKLTASLSFVDYFLFAFKATKVVGRLYRRIKH